MADFWIVTGRTYVRHRSHDAAEAERARLAALVPAKNFVVLRCKSDTRPRPDTRAYIATLEAEIARLQKHFFDAGGGNLSVEVDQMPAPGDAIQFPGTRGKEEA